MDIFFEYEEREACIREIFLRYATQHSELVKREDLENLVKELGKTPPVEFEFNSKDEYRMNFSEFVHYFNACTGETVLPASSSSSTSQAATVSSEPVPPTSTGTVPESAVTPHVPSPPEGAGDQTTEGMSGEKKAEDHGKYDTYHMHGDVDETIDFKTAAGTRVGEEEEQQEFHQVRNPHLRPQAVMVKSGEGIPGGLVRDRSSSVSANVKEREYEEALLRWVGEMEAVDTSDYSLGFSGTKNDTTVENSINLLMRGGEADDKSRFKLQDCTCTMTPDGSHGATCEGRWLRCLNRQGTCYLYVHTITHEVTGKTPTGFYDPEEARRKALLLAAGEFPDFPSCFLENLEEKVAEMVKVEKKTPLLLTGSDEMRMDLAQWFTEQIGVDRQKKPVLRGYVIDTRPLILGQTKTGVKFEDSVKAAKLQLTKAVKNGRLAVIDVADKPPNFADKICNVDKYRNSFPMNLFNPMARGWRKDLLQFNPNSDDDAVVLLSSSSPGDYERDLKENLDPVPWDYLSPINVQMTPIEIVNMKDLLDITMEVHAQNQRIPVIIDATKNRDSVETFWNYQRIFTIDISAAMFQMKGHTPMQDPDTHKQLLESWRKCLVGAMRQGYFLVIKMGESNPDMKDFCDDNYFPYCVFQSGVVGTQEVRDRLYQEDDKEAGVPVLREGFGVVILTSKPLEDFRKYLRHSIPLKNMKALVVMN